MAAVLPMFLKFNPFTGQLFESALLVRFISLSKRFYQWMYFYLQGHLRPPVPIKLLSVSIKWNPKMCKINLFSYISQINSIVVVRVVSQLSELTYKVNNLLLHWGLRWIRNLKHYRSALRYPADPHALVRVRVRRKCRKHFPKADRLWRGAKAGEKKRNVTVEQDMLVHARYQGRDRVMEGAPKRGHRRRYEPVISYNLLEPPYAQREPRKVAIFLSFNRQIRLTSVPCTDCFCNNWINC